MEEQMIYEANSACFPQPLAPPHQFSTEAEEASNFKTVFAQTVGVYTMLLPAQQLPDRHMSSPFT